MILNTSSYQFEIHLFNQLKTSLISSFQCPCQSQMVVMHTSGPSSSIVHSLTEDPGMHSIVNDRLPLLPLLLLLLLLLLLPLTTMLFLIFSNEIVDRCHASAKGISSSSWFPSPAEPAQARRRRQRRGPSPDFRHSKDSPAPPPDMRQAPPRSESVVSGTGLTRSTSGFQMPVEAPTSTHIRREHSNGDLADD